MSELQEILNATQCPECKRLRARNERLEVVLDAAKSYISQPEPISDKYLVNAIAALEDKDNE